MTNAILEILLGKEKAEKGTRYSLSTTETLHIGRAPDNDLILDDKRVSRHHAQISYEEGEYFVEDLNTSNGTHINNNKILNQKLHPGDVIQIGSYSFRFLVTSHFEEPPTKELSSARGSSPPQQETISRTPYTQSTSFRPILYTMGGVFLVFVIWVLSFPSKPSKPSQISRALTSDLLSSSRTKEDSVPLYSINWEKANQFYLSGYREFFSENYLRALDDFKTALELYPDHRLAQIYLKKTEDTISEKVDHHYKSAMNYFNSAQYQLAIYHFTQVITFTKHRKPPEGYCALRAEKSSLLENPDFEKYCESLEKIAEARSREN